MITERKTVKFEFNKRKHVVIMKPWKGLRVYLNDGNRDFGYVEGGKFVLPREGSTSAAWIETMKAAVMAAMGEE